MSTAAGGLPFRAEARNAVTQPIRRAGRHLSKRVPGGAWGRSPPQSALIVRDAAQEGDLATWTHATLLSRSIDR